MDLYQLVQKTMKVEMSEMSNRGRNQKEKFARGGSSSSKRIRESRAELVYSSAARGRGQGPTVAPSSGRSTSTGKGEILECPHCHKRHSGICRWLTRGCFRCGSTDHLLANCLRESREFRNPQGSGRGGSNAPLVTRDRGGGQGVLRQQRGRGSTVSEIVDRPISTTPARAYAMKAREDLDASEVIVGIFSLYDMEIHAFIDPGSTHSYVCTEHLFDKMPSIEQLEYDIHVTSPLRHSVNGNRVYKNFPIMIHDRKFSANLIALPFRENDLILGMDWLSKHRAIVDWDKKSVLLKCPD